MNLNEELVHFVLTSSFFIIIYPLLFLYHAYNHLTDEEKKESKINFEQIAIFLPIVFGVIFAIIYNITSSIIPRKYKDIYVRYIASGVITSIIINFIFQYGFGIHDIWLKLENPNITYVLVPLFYFIVFFTIGVWLRQQVLYGPDSGSNSASPSISPSSMIPSSISPSSMIPSTDSLSPNLKKNLSSNSLLSNLKSNKSVKSDVSNISSKIYDKLQNKSKS